mmetsp:Transcript_26423/g.39214  ORF Transcript_26423/g.39214 Transcript_26423/m.39214 type:complete len:1955 (+) Transcript_26423:136-6000(+)|eukprot:CAMPEP_0185020218 /NCGR_PEP_ID=MMETSP1103-20130426/2814_1 /TAXON_ID=36769 /ORGANISM="Paraphysomonas bandaiensis, Strain Caron Lab Isolate" /LENGTH=1954 /DNA_ID=CAMNT_0027550983 /DNA_START=119 /DNA_END=5983 /DNA_ORIENTATION=+
MSKQLKAILWKNYLLKIAHPWGTAAEILLPVLFMALLILIKQITSSYDSPNIAYYCGNAYPWFYTSDITNDSTPVTCLEKPAGCSESNYYRGSFRSGTGEKLYEQYGYVDSAASYGSSNNPFYTFTVGDESQLYEQTGTDNPSLPMYNILERLQLNNVILAISPVHYSDELYSQCQNLSSYILEETSQDFAETIKLFKSKNEMDNYMTDKDYDDEDYEWGKIGLGIMLYEADVAGIKWEYAIRTNYSYPWEADNDDTVACLYGGGNNESYSCDFIYSIPSTQFYTQDLYKPQSMEFIYGYSYSGFSTLQLVMDKYIFSQYGSDVNIMASMGLMPTKKYETDDFQYVIASTLGIFYMLSFLYPVSRIVRGLVLEKEDRIKEGMKMMGLTEFAYNMSWLITTVTQMALVSLLIVLVTMTSVFEYSDKFLVFIYFMAFSLAVINMCFLMSTFFSRSKIASLMGPMIFFATFFPYYAVSDPSYSTSVKTATCLLAPSCFALGANVFADYEGGLVGVQTSNSSEMTSNFSYALCVTMMCVDAVLYGVLAWYFDKIIPSEYGTQKPFYFPFLPSYWCGIKLSAKEESLLAAGERVASSEEDTSKIEPVSNDLLRQQEENRCVMIRNLRRVFQTTAEDRVAVKNLSMDIYEGQCTVLLGHNGAGKSTTISMLTGLIPPSSGDAIVEGKRISQDMQFIRQSLGVCPQHDILFPDLTVMQHLQIYAAFKGVKSSEVDAAATKMIREVGLKEKTNIKSSMLSGGQKRKLSLGIALIGDSKVVILDEPTSGMDPYSRRSTWNIIQRNKKNRVILMTTHFMDEADILGDRIAIMAEGQLRCFGSSLFLKKNYGVGYTFTIVRESQAGSTARGVKDLVMKYVPQAEPLSLVGAEQSYRLPFSATPVFVDMFTEMDQKKSTLGIAEYGISVTTLEEVFIRVGKNTEDIVERESIVGFVEERKRSGSAQSKDALQDKENGSAESPQKVNSSGDNDVMSPIVSAEKSVTTDKYAGVGSLETDTDSAVFFKHFRALFLKRVIYGKRDRRMFICQVVLPVLLVVLGLGLLQLQPGFNQPGLTLTPGKYNPLKNKVDRNYVVFNTEDGTLGDQIMSRFNGDFDGENDGTDGGGVWGLAVPITPEEDEFYNCSQGAAPLFDSSNYMIKNIKPKGQKGSSHYGSVTVAGESTLNDLSYNVMINGSAVHGAGVYMNLVHEAFLQVLTGVGAASITVRNYPLPRTWEQENNAASVDAFTAALFFMIAFCFIPASYAAFIVKEKEVKAKHQQIISGVSIYAYWFSTFAWDVLSYLPTVALVICIVLAFGVDNYTKNDGGTATFLLFLLFGPAVAAFTYLMSFIFTSHSTAQLVVMFFNFLSGLCLMVVSFVLTNINSTESIAVDLRYLFRLFPSFCLGDGLTQLALCDNGKDCPNISREGYDWDSTVSPYHWNVVGANLVFLAVETVVYFGLALMTEYSLTFPSLLLWLHKVNDAGHDPKTPEDEDVARERERVKRGDADGDVVKIDEMRKVFNTPIGQKVAVQSLAFGIPKGECFGFLGINGAGKTTTLSILSGEFPPTSGTAYIDGYDIKLDQSNIRRKIGYCPQFDALLELLTVREHLELYGRIKGMEGDRLQEVVRGKLEQMNLTDFEHKAAGSLSGGNKRKLSVAIAMIGEPSIIFLDEPSTGMDPMARRFMWQVISRISTQDALCSIILTTHSMEEAEALCTRIGIMVNGGLRCLGSGQHLKQRFGDGYEVDIKINFATMTAMRPLADQLSDAGLVNLHNIQLDESGHDGVENGHAGDEDAEEAWFNRIRITSDWKSLCAALLEPERADMIVPNGEGGTLYDMMHADGFVLLRTFLEWWIAQDDAIRLDSFMSGSFPGAILLERSTAHSFRYRIPTKEMALASVFRNFEDAKERLNIQDYSVGQTTLEQIFNQFAAHQDNPEVEKTDPTPSRESFNLSKGSALKRTNTSPGI